MLGDVLALKTAKMMEANTEAIQDPVHMKGQPRRDISLTST